MQYPTAPEHQPIPFPAMHMGWHDLLFMHWRWDPNDLQRLLPGPLLPDIFDGSAWVGVVPFSMIRIAAGPAPWLRLAPDFLELNLRTYVRHPDGRTGVWFLTLDCNHRLSVLGARSSFALNYNNATMSARRKGGVMVFQSSRAGYRSFFRYRPASIWRSATIDPLDSFLAERYRLFTWRQNPKQLMVGQVSHETYQIADAEVQMDCTGFFTLNGLTPPAHGPDHMAVAKPVQVRAGFPWLA